MKKIDRKTMERIGDHAGNVSALYDEIEELVDKFWSEIEAKLAELNGERQELHGILDDIVSEAETYYDERSEKWQESDAGSAYSDWKDGISFLRDQVDDDVDAPDKPSFERPDWVTECDDIQTEPEA